MQQAALFSTKMGRRLGLLERTYGMSSHIPIVAWQRHALAQPLQRVYKPRLKVNEGYIWNMQISEGNLQTEPTSNLRSCRVFFIFFFVLLAKLHIKKTYSNL